MPVATHDKTAYAVLEAGHYKTCLFWFLLGFGQIDGGKKIFFSRKC